MSLNESAAAAVKKKVTLLEEDFPRFAVRATLGGVYLALGTAFAVVAGQAVENLAPGMGSLTFSFLFGFGLFSIILLGADLATGDMMYMVYGAVQKYTSWAKAFYLIIVCTIFNLVGAILIAVMLAQTAKFAHITPDHLMATITEAKLHKGPFDAFVEAIIANFVVNMAVLGAIFCKDVASKFLTIIPIIAIFVGMGLEHVIANFCLMGITFFTANPMIESMAFGPVAMNWAVVWVGNVVGGGFLIGGLYAWLNRGSEAFRD